MKQNHKIFFVIATVLTVFSWIFAIYYWDKLPSVIPVHFGIDGMVDNWADKSLFYAYLLPALQTVILGLFIFIYYKPQYSNIPSTMWLMTLDKKRRDYAFDLIRKMLVGTLILISILFTYITYAMNAAAVDSEITLSPFLMIIIITALIGWSIFWAVAIYHAVRKSISFKK